MWYPAERVIAVPHDTPIAGWRGKHVNTLRLWSAHAYDPVQLAAFNRGRLCRRHRCARAGRGDLARALPERCTPEGQELRLRQEYFFTSASLQDLIRRHLDEFGTLDNLADHAAVQLNDTHPAVAVAELMRLLVDEHEMSLDAGVANHAGDTELHQSHAIARSAGKLAARPVRPAAAAPSADHLPDQLAHLQETRQPRA